MAKKRKWTDAQRKAASKRMKAKYAAKRKEQKEIPVEVVTNVPLKTGGLIRRLNALHEVAQEVADEVLSIINGIENL